jgi:hypothetical protein
MKFDPRSKSGKPSIAIMIGVKPSKKDDKKKYGGGPDMKKAWRYEDKPKPIDMSEHIRGDPTRPFGHSMEQGDSLIDTARPRRIRQYAGDVPEEGLEDREPEGQIDSESLRESNPELFEMDDPRWKDREPAPKGYEYGRDGRLRRVSPDEGRRPWDSDDVSNLLARNRMQAKGNDSIAMSMDDPMSAAWGLLRG